MTSAKVRVCEVGEGSAALIQSTKVVRSEGLGLLD